MPRNGSGTYERVHNWTDDAGAGIPIEASRMDAEDDSIAQALTDSIAKDGQTTPTANLPMGGYAHTSVGNATARNQYAAVGQVQDSAFNYATTGGSSNAYTLGVSPSITAYAAGQRFIFNANHTNSGAATLNVSGLGTKAIQRPDGSALSASDITSGQIYDVVYDGTAFKLTTLDLSLGTMATQDADSVAITGGTIDGTTAFEGVINDGTTFEVAATTRTNLGLGTMATQAASAVAITGGTITAALSETTTTKDASGGNDYLTGYRGIPQNAQDTAYQFVLGDAGKSVGKASTTARAYTVPPNSTVAFPLGTAITIYNMGASGNITITEGSGVDIYLAGNGTPGNRTLGAYGICTILKVATDTWLASGTVLT